MDFLDFHHHKKNHFGIYNLDFWEDPGESFFSAGIHPKDIGENLDENLDRIKEISLLPNCFAIGECGLDALVPAPEKIQEEVFLRHILWANEIRKPIIIHCVRRFPEVLRFRKYAETALVIHGFNKKKTVAEALLSEGFYLSFGNALLHALSLQEIFREMPHDRFFLETDDADVDIEEIYQKAAEILKTSPENVLSQVQENLDKIKK